jgi:hypothetical protein
MQYRRLQINPDHMQIRLIGDSASESRANVPGTRVFMDGTSPKALAVLATLAAQAAKATETNRETKQVFSSSSRHQAEPETHTEQKEGEDEDNDIDFDWREYDDDEEPTPPPAVDKTPDHSPDASPSVHPSVSASLRTFTCTVGLSPFHCFVLMHAYRNAHWDSGLAVESVLWPRRTRVPCPFRCF